MENNETNETNMAGDSDGGEVLVVASKLKNYIRAKSGGMNTSAAVMSILSQKIRGICDNAIENAKREGRKTVMDRDFT